MEKSKKLWKDFPEYGIIMLKFGHCDHFDGCDIMEYTFQQENISEAIELCSISAGGFKSACVTVSFVMPLCEKASAYALVPNVLARSSARYPDLTSIERKLAKLYGAELVVDVSKTGDHQVLKMGVSCIDDRFAFDGESITAECSKLLFEVLFNPRLVDGAFSADDVESEKRLLAERLASENSDKRAYAKNRCEEIMFSGDVYGIHRFGTAEAIAQVTPQSLFAAYNEVLSQAKIVVCVSGNTDLELVRKSLVEHTCTLNRAPVTSKTTFVKSAAEVKYEKEQEAVKQGKLVMGFRMGMENANDMYFARRVMSDLFGGSPHSKLFTVVREKMSLCYYCSARLQRPKGVMLVQSGIESENEDKARQAILDQLEDIKNGSFSDEDVEASVKALEDSFKSVSDSPESLDSWFMAQCVSGAYHRPEYFIDGFKSVTRDEIIEVAKQVTLDTVFMLEGTAEGGESDE
ncbi:MAG: insulinase family protein [Clostridia bacterium]|nr:insulinase family protein [Clostridia bacterium]